MRRNPASLVFECVKKRIFLPFHIQLLGFHKKKKKKRWIFVGFR